MAEWCQKCGTYHDVTTAGGCPDKEDKLWVGTYAEGFRAGQEAAERRAAALEAECGRLLEYVDGNDKDTEIAALRTKVPQCTEKEL